MNTENFTAWLKSQGQCFNHMNTAEKDRAVKAYKASLAKAKEWVSQSLGAEAIAKEHPTLADCAAKFEGEPLQEFEILSALGRATWEAQEVSDSVVILPAESFGPTVTRELPPGTYPATLNSMKIIEGRLDAKMTILGIDHAATIGGDLSVGFSTRLYKCKPVKGHRPKTYKPHSLVIRTSHFSAMLQCVRSSDQDDYVCRIEAELLQYAGKRRTPHRDRKVAKLLKTLRILKRGLYE